MSASTYLVLFTFKLEPIKGQDAAKSQILDLSSPPNGFLVGLSVKILKEFQISLSSLPLTHKFSCEETLTQEIYMSDFL